MMYVFGYGSLMEPTSLARTVPGVNLEACLPARAMGAARAFTTIFPNDGSQPDKAYWDTDGKRPAGVMLCNLILGHAPAANGANGVCIPVTSGELAALRRRELRYDEVDISSLIRPYPGFPAPDHVLAYIGKARFTSESPQAAAADAAVVNSSYLDTIAAGARFWDRRAPGFAADYEATTTMPAQAQIRALRRADSPQ